VAAEGSKKRVLVVDADSHTRQMVRNALEAKDFAVDIVGDGDEALAACRAQQPSALIVASKLPRMDGFVFMRKLRQEGLLRVIPVIMIAEANEQARSGLALTRGARVFLPKPLSVRKLVNHVVELTLEENTEVLRREPRIPHVERVEVRRDGADSFEPMDTANVSRGGAFISSDRPPPPFTDVAVRFPSQPDVVLKAQVRHVVPSERATEGAPAGMGIRFRGGDEASQESVARLVERATVQKGTLKPLVQKAVRRDAVKKEPPKETVRKENIESALENEEKVLERLKRELEAVKAQSVWERLAVEKDANIDEVSRAFTRAAVAYHSDRYSRYGRKVRDTAQDIYLLLTEAKSALRRAARTTARGLGPSAQPARSDSTRPPARDDSARPPARGDSTRPPAPSSAPAASALPVASTLPAPSTLPAVSSAPAPAEMSLPPVVSTLPGNASTAPAASSALPPVLPPSDAPTAPPAADTSWLEALKHTPTFDSVEPEEPPQEEPSSPEDEEIARRRAQALEALANGRYRDAKNQLARLIDRGHDDNELLLAERLARAYLSREEGNLEEAMTHLEAAREIDPESGEVAAAMRSLREKSATQGKGLFRRLLGG
jgi:CheY-like chemotaxis protein